MDVPSTLATARTPLAALRFDRRELAGAVADLGVLVPISVALIVQNGLSATAVLLPAGLLYVGVGAYYRLPVSVQPLKAFGAIAIAQGLSVDAIAAGAILMGLLFVLLGSTRLLDRAAAVFPRAVVRGVQLSVGLLFVKLGWGLVTSPPTAFADADQPPLLLAGAAVAVGLVALVLRRRAVTLLLVAAAAVVAVAGYDGAWAIGPSVLEVPSPDIATFAVAAVALVLPQLPLTFANSCLAAADVARTYYGDAARRVTASRLGMSLGVANLAVGAVGGMPLCHGAGGMTAHRAFGARSGGAPLVLGGALVVLALLGGSVLAGVLVEFPLPVLAALLAVAGVLHLGLLRDLERPFEWVVAVAIGLGGLLGQLAPALLLGMALWWGAHALMPAWTTEVRS